MAAGIKLIVGLGNPGAEYAKTRHNVGAWFVGQLAESAQQTLRNEAKFFGLVARVTMAGESCWLLQPTTYMNDSGQAIQAIAKFYKIKPEEILVAHDELDFPVGKVRIKENGGHGGHNGLRDTIAHLHANNFYRLRIGIGHPGHKDHVTPYVLGEPSRGDKELIINAIDAALRTVPDLIGGDLQRAMRTLHEENNNGL